MPVDSEWQINAATKSVGASASAWFEDEPGDLSHETTDSTTAQTALIQVRSVHRTKKHALCFLALGHKDLIECNKVVVAADILTSKLEMCKHI